MSSHHVSAMELAEQLLNPEFEAGFQQAYDERRAANPAMPSYQDFLVDLAQRAADEATLANPDLQASLAQFHAGDIRPV